MFMSKACLPLFLEQCPVAEMREYVHMHAAIEYTTVIKYETTTHARFYMVVRMSAPMWDDRDVMEFCRINEMDALYTALDMDLPFVAMMESADMLLMVHKVNAICSGINTDNAVWLLLLLLRMYRYEQVSGHQSVLGLALREVAKQRTNVFWMEVDFSVPIVRGKIGAAPTAALPKLAEALPCIYGEVCCAAE